MEVQATTMQNNVGSYQGSATVVNPVDKVEEVTNSKIITAAEETKNGTTEERGQASDEQIKQAVSEINKRASNTRAVYGIHEGTNRVTIKILDKDSDRVIKEFPAEETLNMIEKLWEVAGLLVDEKR